MSSMFKGIFKQLGHKNDHKSTFSNSPYLNSSPSGLAAELSPSKPFEINLEDLASYETKDLHNFIIKYDEFLTQLSRKHEDVASENIILREKLSLMDQERRRLLDENEQFKLHIENLKAVIDEKVVANSSGSIHSTKSSSPRGLEDMMLSEMVSEKSEDLSENLKKKAEELLSELSKFEDKIFPKEAHKEAEEGENRDVEENQEPVNEENKDLAKYKEVQKGLETLAVEFSEALEKAKLKEREMLEKIRLEAVEKGKLEQNEQELQTLKNKLVDAQKQITKEKEVTEEEKKKGMTALEKSSEEIKKLEGSIRAQKNRIDELEQINEGLKDTIRNFEVERDHSIKEEIERDMKAYKATIAALEEEKKKFETRVLNAQTKQEDAENKLIQEKLKHHNTLNDLTRAKEKVVEAERYLNEEVEARKADLDKHEELKKFVRTIEKKAKEYKGMIRKLAEEKGMSFKTPEKTLEKTPERTRANLSTEISLDSVDKSHNIDHDDCLRKEEDFVIRIRRLEENLEDVTQQMNELEKAKADATNANDELKGQLKVIQEKRESGLKEIQRLSQVLEQHMRMHTGYSSSPLVLQSRNSSSVFEDASGLKTLRAASSVIRPADSGRTQKKSMFLQQAVKKEELESLKKVKKGLDEIYKEIIMTITNDDVVEEVKSPAFGKNFVKIEKKMNDMIVTIQESIENME